MVCRHCPRPPWRPAPIALLLPPLLLSLVLATTQRPHTNTPPPTLSHATSPPTTKATDHHAHQHSHSHHTHHPILAAVRSDTQCAAVAHLDSNSQEELPQEKLPAKCQTCEGDEKCLRGDAPCPRLKETLCDEEQEEKRKEKIRRITLRYCPHLALQSVMCRNQARRVTDTTLARCVTQARHLQEIDDMVGRVLMQHYSLMAKYNCEYEYSITQNCTGCQEAYRYWVCSQLFPYYNHNGERVKPCRSFCHEVEQKCPYFLPKYKPVAGEPTFLCQDPDIGELSEQESSYGAESCCYHMLCGRGHGSPAGVPRPHASPDHLHHLRLHPHHHRRRRLIHHHLLRRQRRRWKRVP
ncbi:uncharacterized protein LOC123510942 isoform X3 [Portunus trituberculatus]|uniref:uncharacterized protein LOC123510942 isoform X3 n=1 Tax=Portunus trituberculatus TaxID=210409 RepID=UPI001E1D003A|nr:uncharacterized protein LOC123510942 isoform X3 [Portunus trituberculatus]